VPGPERAGRGAAWPSKEDAEAAVLVADPTAPELPTSEAHHLVRVLRLASGSRVLALDGRGGWCRCRLLVRSGGRAWLEPEGPLRRAPRLAPVLTIGLPLVKGDRTDWAVQKLTELGVDRIVLVRTRRGVVQVAGDRAVRLRERLQRVAVAALCQSRGPWLPELLGPLDLVELDGLLDAEGGGPVGVCGLGGSREPDLGLPAVLVGPEGGLVPEELVDARGRPRPQVDLGPTVLRVETAAVALASRLVGLRWSAAKGTARDGS